MRLYVDWRVNLDNVYQSYYYYGLTVKSQSQNRRQMYIRLLYRPLVLKGQGAQEHSAALEKE